MNFRLILNIMGYTLWVEAGCLLLPAVFVDAGAVQPVRADPHPHPGPEEPFAGPGRLCGGGHGVDRAVPVRGSALRPQRGCPPLC